MWIGKGMPSPFLPIWRVPAGRMKRILDLKDEEAFEHISLLTGRLSTCCAPCAA